MMSGAWIVAPAVSAQEAVTFAGQDGFVLHGVLYEPAEPATVRVLLLHQCNRREGESGLAPLAERLASAGMVVLEYDSRGFGRSRDGTFRHYRAQMKEIEPHENEDANAAYEFLRRRGGVAAERSAVVGLSCGTGKAIELARRHGALEAMVLISGSWPDDAASRNAYAGVAGIPVFAVYSEDDVYDTPGSMKRLFGASRSDESQLRAYKGDLHGAPLLARERDLAGHIVEWLVRRAGKGAR